AWGAEGGRCAPHRVGRARRGALSRGAVPRGGSATWGQCRVVANADLATPGLRVDLELGISPSGVPAVLTRGHGYPPHAPGSTPPTQAPQIRIMHSTHG